MDTFVYVGKFACKNYKIVRGVVMKKKASLASFMQFRHPPCCQCTARVLGKLIAKLCFYFLKCFIAMKLDFHWPPEKAMSAICVSLGCLENFVESCDKLALEIGQKNLRLQVVNVYS